MDATGYARNGSKSVKGWLAPESASLVQAVASEQVRYGTRGGVGEIGVHHGRLFILLYLLARADERAVAIGVFEAQHLHIDRSGEDDRQMFEGNLRRVGADLTRIEIIAKSSMDVTSEEIRAAAGPIRLFSIDGGHTTSIALNDLCLTERTLCDGGVVILDDAFQSLFPGVAAGLARYLMNGHSLVPFAVSPEKVLLTQPEHHDRMLKAATEGMGDCDLRCEDYFGSEVAIIRTRPRRQELLQLGVGNTRIYKQLRDTPVVGTAVEALRPLVLKALRR